MSERADQTETCSCGTGRTYDACCGPLIAGEPARTAEALMRSRYTAYARGLIDHIVASHEPKGRDEVDRGETEKWSKDNRWVGLEILSTDQGGEADETGVVEFVAKFQPTGAEQPIKHHERAKFQKLDGRWFFVDGDMVKQAPVVRAEAKVGRNDVCPCGSGKKYKRCHGA